MNVNVGVIGANRTFEDGIKGKDAAFNDGSEDVGVEHKGGGELLGSFWDKGGTSPLLFITCN